MPGSHRQLERRLYVLRKTLPSVEETKAGQSPNEKQSLATFIDDHLEHEHSADEFEPLELPAGSCVLIDGFVVHESHENLSNKSRPAFTLHLVDMPEGVSWPAGNWLQPTADYQFPLLYDEQN